MAPAAGNSYKERTFADFDIDPLTLDAEGNDKVLDLIEENNTLTHEVRDLRSQLAQQAADVREASKGPSPEAIAEMQAELERLMTENADLKTGVKSGSRPGTPGLVRKGSGGQLVGKALARQASDGSAADYTLKLEDEVDTLMAEVSDLLKKVDQLEDELETAKAVPAAAVPAPPPNDAELAELREENATLQRRLTALQAQVDSGRVLGKIPSDKEVAESEALVAEIMGLQAQVEGGGVPQDTARDSAERTLAALAEQNQRLSSEKAAAEAQARDAAAERAAAQEALDALTERHAALSDEVAELRSTTAASMAPRTPSKIDMKLLAAVEKHKAEAEQMAERNAALSGSVRALQSQLAVAEAATLAAAGMTAQLDAAKAELSELRDTKMLRGDADSIRDALAKQAQAEKDAAEAKKRAAEALAGRADAQRALDNVAKRVAELEAVIDSLREDIVRLEAEVADLTRSSATGAATLGEQLAEQQERWARERRELVREGAQAKEAASALADENQALIARVQRLVPAPDRAGSSASDSRDGSPTKALASGEGNIALMRDLAEENDKLAAENARLADSAKTLLQQNSELMNQLIDVSLGGGGAEEEDHPAAISESPAAPGTGGARRDSYISPSKLAAQRRQQEQRTPVSAQSSGRPAAADGTPGSAMSLPASPDDAAPALQPSPAAAQQSQRLTQAAVQQQQQRQDAAAGSGKPKSAMAALAALYAKEDAASSSGGSPRARQQEPPEAAREAGSAEAVISPRAHNGDVDVLRRRHAQLAEQVERSQQVAEEDAGRRATLQSRTKQHLDAYEKVKAEALQRLQSFASQSSGATPAKPPRGESGAAGVPRAASFSRTGSVRINSAASSSAGDSPRQPAAPYGGFMPPPSSGHRRRTSGASDIAPAAVDAGQQQQAGVRDSPVSSGARDDAASIAGSSRQSSVVINSGAGVGAGAGFSELRSFNGGGGRNYSDASEGSAGGSFSTPVRRRSSVSEASGADRAEATRRLQEEAALQRPESLEGVRTADRRARQELEEAARLKTRAEALVHKANFRYSGNEENVGAFMQALGYDFRADPVADADGLLFKRALRITHPDNSQGADAWGRAVAAAAHAQLQEWQARALLL